MSKPTSRAKREAVLLVEDHGAVRAAGSAVLELQGYRVCAAGNAAEALEIARDRQPELALLVVDVVLPGRDGHATVELVRELRAGLPILYMSGYPRDARLPELRPGTRSSFIQKPFSAAELAEAIAELLAEGRSPSAP